MALIERHPDVADYIVEISLPDIRARGGIADLFEEGQLILIKDFRLDFDTEALAALSKSTDAITDPVLRKKVKKLTSPLFFEGDPPRGWGRKLTFSDNLRQTIFDVLCRGDRKVFERASKALRHSHDEALRIFETCFPSYDPFRFVPSLRLTQTLFENLHWDNHSIDDDFHQARLFANLDSRPRIWSVSHRLTDWVRDHYHEYDLGRFAGRDPNEMIDFVGGEVLGGTIQTWMDSLPRHRIAFEPGEVWLGESRLISHQIYYGEAAMVYMWFVNVSSMASQKNRFNAQVAVVHEQMRAQLAAE